MRVRVNKDLTFYYELVPYTVTAGTELDGLAAQHLVATNADVTVLDGEPAAEPEQAVTGDELDITGKIADVLAWVGDDQDRALEAHAAEEAKGDKARPRLLAQLEAIATGEQAPAGTVEDETSDSDD